MLDKADPFAFCAELPPADRVARLARCDYEWHDADWMRAARASATR